MTAATLAADAAPEPANSTTGSQSPASSAPPSSSTISTRLCHCRRPGDRSGILPADIRHRADAQRLPHLRHRLPRPSAGLGAVRPLRRPHRAQVDPGRLAAADGGVHHPDRRPPRLRQHRLLGAVAALRAALRPGPRPASGAAPRCWPRRTRRPASAPGSACFPSSARRSASSPPTACSWPWRCCSARSSSVSGAGGSRSCSARRWLWSASTYA